MSVSAIMERIVNGDAVPGVKGGGGALARTGPMAQGWRMKTALLPALALAVLCLQPLAAAAQTAPAGGFPAPDRRVAGIVSPIWSSGPDRDAADEAGQLVRGLGIRPGMAVADIGAGSGYHTVRLSPVVGPKGRIFAQDVTAAYMAELRREVARRKLANVEFVLGAEGDPGLSPSTIDRAILVHMYHEIGQPYGLLWRLADALKPGAKVGVIDLNRRPEQHGMPPALLRCEFEAVGYRQERFIELKGGIGYLAVFAPPRPGERPQPGAIRACKAGR
jgi:predicted methyltransferase